MKNHVYKNTWTPGWHRRYRNKHTGGIDSENISRFEAFCRIKGIWRKTKKELKRHYGELPDEAFYNKVDEYLNALLLICNDYFGNGDSNEMFWYNMGIQFKHFCNLYPQ